MSARVNESLLDRQVGSFLAAAGLKLVQYAMDVILDGMDRDIEFRRNFTVGSVSDDQP